MRYFCTSSRDLVTLTVFRIASVYISNLPVPIMSLLWLAVPAWRSIKGFWRGEWVEFWAFPFTCFVAITTLATTVRVWSSSMGRVTLTMECSKNCAITLYVACCLVGLGLGIDQCLVGWCCTRIYTTFHCRCHSPSSASEMTYIVSSQWRF